jgi:adenosine deaminase
MAMIRFLSAKYPKVRRTLHAGELAPGLVAPQHMQDHIAKALAAGAQRIGHGVDIGYEANSRQTLAQMARHHVAVEINLSSNDVILGVKGKDHPLGLYRRAGVPFVLSTDDAGVLRTDMTREYVRAVREQGLTYGELRQVARASLEYSFLPGSSLWASGRIGTVVAGCKVSFAVESCTKLLDVSEKAKAQADLETRLAAFERGAIAMAAPKSTGIAP